jgi:peptidoglycan/LPS O-acetylase OafA/YrhL
MANGHTQRQAAARDIPALTGLRFLAALSVAISHGIQHIVPFAGTTPLWHLMLSQLSGIGMPLFFVLSGFVIHYNYAGIVQAGSGRQIFNFFVARFTRIYPLFIICVFGDLAWKLCYAQLPATTGQALPFYLTMTQSWVFRLLGGQALIFQFGWSPQVAWSVSTEWFFYCAYPLICLLVMRLRTARSTGAVIGLLVVVASGGLILGIYFANAIDAFAAARIDPAAGAGSGNLSFRFWLFYFSPYLRILEFLLGCLCAHLVMKLGDPATRAVRPRSGTALTVAAVILIAGLYLLFYPLAGLVPALVPYFILIRQGFGPAIPCALLIFCCARYDNGVVRLLAAPRLVFCGEASYSLYLLHMIVIDAFRFETADSGISPLIAVGNLMRLALTLTTAIGLSLVSWQIVEIPARRFLRKRLTVQSSPTDDASALRPV